MKNNSLYLLPGMAWLLISTFLLTLPGKSFPKEDWLSKIWFDKWVHIVMFILLVILWCRGFSKILSNRNSLRKTFIFATILSLGYGITMEYVQQHWISNRSFDSLDIVADAIGCIAGFIYCNGRYIKK